MAKTETHIPKLRFSGFSDPWQKNKLKNIGKISIGGDVNQKAIQELGRFPVIANGLGNDGVVGFYDNYKITAPAITISGRGVGIGFTKARFQNFTPVVRLIVLQAPKFDAYFLENNISRLNFFIESTGVPQLTAPQFGQYEIYYSSVVEQIQIGDFFQKIDQVIELQQKVLETAQDYKKSMLQKMFPQKGEKVPKVRFDGFSGDWEKKELSKAIEREIKGKAQVSNLQAGDIEYLDAERLNGGNPIFVNLEKDVEEKDILILWDGSKAGTIYYGFSGVLGSTLKSYKINSIFNSSFIYCFLKSQEEMIFNQYRTPNIPHVVKDFTRIFYIPKTKLEEQQKIGAFFQKLDQQIAQHEKKLESYQSLKKAMLQRMFV